MATDTACLAIPKEILQEAVNEHMRLALTKVFDDKSIIANIVKGIISQRVDINGQPSNSRWDTYTWLEWAVNQNLHSFIQQALVDELKKNSELITHCIVEDLKSNKSNAAAGLASAIMRGFVKDLDKHHWHINLEYTGPNNERTEEN